MRSIIVAFVVILLLVSYEAFKLCKLSGIGRGTEVLNTLLCFRKILHRRNVSPHTFVVYRREVLGLSPTQTKKWKKLKMDISQSSSFRVSTIRRMSFLLCCLKGFSFQLSEIILMSLSFLWFLIKSTFRFPQGLQKNVRRYSLSIIQLVFLFLSFFLFCFLVFNFPLNMPVFCFVDVGNPLKLQIIRSFSCWVLCIHILYLSHTDDTKPIRAQLYRKTHVSSSLLCSNSVMFMSRNVSCNWQINEIVILYATL